MLLPVACLCCAKQASTGSSITYLASLTHSCTTAQGLVGRLPDNDSEASKKDLALMLPSGRGSCAQQSQRSRDFTGKVPVQSRDVLETKPRGQARSLWSVLSQFAGVARTLFKSFQSRQVTCLSYITVAVQTCFSSFVGLSLS